MDLPIAPLSEVVTNLGAAGLMVPMLALVCAGLWHAGETSAVAGWLVLTSLGAALVLGTKIAFLAFGVGGATLDFTGISGHTTLATAILPVWLDWMLARRRGRYAWVGMRLGLAVGALVGWSRVQLGAHSVSECVFGWLLGAGIAYLTLCQLDRRLAAPRLAWGAGLILLLALSPNRSSYLPTHTWERQLALAISGRGVLYSREDLRRASGARSTGRAPVAVVRLASGAAGVGPDAPILSRPSRFIAGSPTARAL